MFFHPRNVILSPNVGEDVWGNYQGDVVVSYQRPGNPKLSLGVLTLRQVGASTIQVTATGKTKGFHPQASFAWNVYVADRKPDLRMVACMMFPLVAPWRYTREDLMLVASRARDFMRRADQRENGMPLDIVFDLLGGMLHYYRPGELDVFAQTAPGTFMARTDLIHSSGGNRKRLVNMVYAAWRAHENGCAASLNYRGVDAAWAYNETYSVDYDFQMSQYNLDRVDRIPSDL